MKNPKYIKIIFYIVTTIVVILIIARLNELLITIPFILFYVYITYIQKGEQYYRCLNCSMEITKDNYLQFNKNCKYCFYKRYHKIHLEKDRLGIKCRCDIPSCNNCLMKDCKDSNCPVHTEILKNKAKTKDQPRYQRSNNNY